MLDYLVDETLDYILRIKVIMSIKSEREIVLRRMQEIETEA